MFRHVKSRHLMFRHVKSRHVMFRHVKSRHVMFRHVKSHHVNTRHITPTNCVASHHVMSNHVITSRHVTSRRVKTHHSELWISIKRVEFRLRAMIRLHSCDCKMFWCVCVGGRVNSQFSEHRGHKARKLLWTNFCLRDRSFCDLLLCCASHKCREAHKNWIMQSQSGIREQRFRCIGIRSKTQ